MIDFQSRILHFLLFLVHTLLAHFLACSTFSIAGLLAYNGRGRTYACMSAPLCQTHTTLWPGIINAYT